MVEEFGMNFSCFLQPNKKREIFVSKMNRAREKTVRDPNLNREIKLEFGRELFFRVETVSKIYAPEAAVSMNLNSQRLSIISAISSPSKIS